MPRTGIPPHPHRLCQPWTDSTHPTATRKIEWESVYRNSLESNTPKTAWWLHYGTDSRVSDNHPQRTITSQLMSNMDESNHHIQSHRAQRGRDAHWTTSREMASNTSNSIHVAKASWTQQRSLECLQEMFTTHILYYRQSVVDDGQLQSWWTTGKMVSYTPSYPPWMLPLKKCSSLSWWICML